MDAGGGAERCARLLPLRNGTRDSGYRAALKGDQLWREWCVQFNPEHHIKCALQLLAVEFAVATHCKRSSICLNRRKLKLEIPRGFVLHYQLDS